MLRFRARDIPAAEHMSAPTLLIRVGSPFVVLAVFMVQAQISTVQGVEKCVFWVLKNVIHNCTTHTLSQG